MKKTLHDLSEEELNQIKLAANITWEAIAYDVVECDLAMDAYTGSYDREEVWQDVLEANRLITIGNIPHHLQEAILNTPFDEREPFIKRFLPNKKYLV